MTLYRILLFFDSLIGIAFLCLLGWSLYENRGAPPNLVGPLVILAVIAGTIWGGRHLARRGHYVAADILLGLLALLAAGAIWYLYALLSALGGGFLH